MSQTKPISLICLLSLLYICLLNVSLSIASEPSGSAPASKEIAALKEKGKDLYANADFKGAIASYEKAAIADASDPELKGLIDRSKSNMELQKAIRERLSNSEGGMSKALKAKYKGAQTFFDNKQYDKAHSEFQEIWLAAGDYSATYEYLGKIKEIGTRGAGDDPKAAESNSVTVGLNQGKELMAKGQFQAAADVLDKVVKSDANNAEAAKLLAEAKEKANSAGVTQAAPADETKTKIKALLADAEKAMKANDLSAATSCYQQVVALDSSNKAAQKGLTRIEKEKSAAEANQQQAQSDQTASDQAAKIDKFMADGDALIASQQFDQGIQSYNQIIAIDPGNKKATKAIAKAEDAKATAAETAKKDADAKANTDAKQLAARQAAEKNEKIGKALADAGKIDDPAKAKEAYQQVLALDPENRRAGSKIKELDKEIAAVQANLDLQKAEPQTKTQEVAQAKDSVPALESSFVAAPAPAAAAPVPVASAPVAPAPAPAQAVTTLAAAPDPAAPPAIQAVVTPRQDEIVADSAITTPSQTAPANAADVNSLMAEGKALGEQKRYAEAVEKYNKALELDSSNKEAEAQLERMTSLIGKDEGKATVPANREQVGKLLRQANVLYKEKKVADARAAWSKVLDADPANKVAQTYLESTNDEFQRLQADQSKRSEATKQDSAGEEKLNTPITISTTGATTLEDFLGNLSLASGIQFSIAQGSEAFVTASFVDKPLRDILDTVLLPIGLKWNRQKGDVIVVAADLKTKVFNLTADELSKVQTLIDNKSLQRILWGETAKKPLNETVLQLEEREGILMAVDSQQNLEKLTKFINDLHTEQPVELTTKIYTIREEDGPKIKALIDSVISVDKTPYDMDRNVFVEGKNLIIRDSADHIRKIEELLMDQKFIQNLRSDKLQVASFSLIPRETVKEDADLAQAFANKTVQIVETILYSQEGITKAREEGRRLWFDPTTFQLTITDYPDRIDQISSFISSLPELEQRLREEVLPIKNLSAGDMSTQLTSILELSSNGGGETGTGKNANETKVTLRTTTSGSGGEKSWKDMRVRVRRVNENDVNDKTDDSCELMVRTNTNSTQLTLTLYDSQFVDDYEVTVDRIEPSGTVGQGRVYLSIRYVPADQLADPSVEPTPTTEMNPTSSTAPTFTIDAFATQNSLIVRYENPNDLKRVKDLVAKLDKPIPQVNIETRFVTVNEQRAKEFSSQWNFLDLGDPRLNEEIIGTVAGANGTVQQVGLGTLLDNIKGNATSGGFGNDAGEATSIFEPLTEPAALGSNLLKGTTVVNTVLGDFLGNQVSWELRMLEAESVINVVNGPHVVVMDGETANFEIQREFFYPISYSWASIAGTNTGSTATTANTGTNTAATGTGTASAAVKALADAIGTNSTSNNNNSSSNNSNNTSNDTSNGSVQDQVIMEVSPTITSENSILLDLNVEVDDIEGGRQGDVMWSKSSVPSSSLTEQRDFVDSIAQGGSPDFTRQHKTVITKARIKSGGIIVLGGWSGEFSQDMTSGVPGLRNLPYLGKLLFSRNKYTSYKTTLLIFLSGQIID